ncbi:MAG: hypothetical protein AAGG01_08055 [Planctomycetota bacterium]
MQQLHRFLTSGAFLLLVGQAEAACTGVLQNSSAASAGAQLDRGAPLARPQIRWEPVGEPSVGGRVTSIAVSPFDTSVVLSGGDMLGIARSTNGGDSWGATTGLLSWEVGEITWHPSDPSRVWAGTMGGPYESRDGGRMWQIRRSGFPAEASFDFSAPVEVVLFDPGNDERLLAAGGTSRRWRIDQVNGAIGAVWESLDGGASWTRLSTIVDGGSTSAPDAVGEAIVGMAFAAGSSARLYATVHERGVYVSSDGGASWSPSNAGLPHLEVERIRVDPDDPDLAYVSLDNQGTAFGGIYRSTDGGTTWDDAANVALGGGRYRGRGYSGLVATEVTVNPFDGEFWIAQGFDGSRVLQSLDGGQSWTFEANQNGTFKGGADASFASATTAYASIGFQTTYQGVGRTFDGGQTWDVVVGAAVGLPGESDAVKAGAIHASRTQPGHVWTVVGGDVYRSTDFGSSWALILAGADAGWFAASLDEGQLWLSTESGVLESTDGISFASIDGPARPGKLRTGPDGTLWIAAHDRTGNPGLGLWCYTAQGGWEAVLDPSQLMGDARTRAEYAVAVALHPSDPDILAFSTADPPFRDISRASGVYLSLNGGSTFTAIREGLPLLRGAALSFHPTDVDRLLLGTGGRGFFSCRIR